MSSHLHWEWFIWRREQIATNIYHRQVCWRKLIDFMFTGSFWHINSLLSCIVPRISVVTSDQLVTRGSGSESCRRLKISSMVQDSFLLQFVPWISIYLVFLPFSCLLSNFLDVDECTSLIHGCHYNASCNNTDGSYTCKCKTGFNCSKYKKCCLIFFLIVLFRSLTDNDLRDPLQTAPDINSDKMCV